MSDSLEALKQIRKLINVASESDDIDFIYKNLREMRRIVNSTIPKSKKPKLKIVK